MWKLAFLSRGASRAGLHFPHDRRAGFWTTKSPFWHFTRDSGSRLFPTGARIKRRHLGANLSGILSEVLLVYSPVMADDERHHAAFAIHVGIRDHRKAGNHAAVDHVVVCAAGCALALAGENAEVIPTVRITRYVPLEIRGTLGDQRPKGT